METEINKLRVGRRDFQLWWFLEVGSCLACGRYHPQSSWVSSVRKSRCKKIVQPDLPLKYSWDMMGKVAIISRLCNIGAASEAVLVLWSNSSQHLTMTDLFAHSFPLQLGWGGELGKKKKENSWTDVTTV